MTRTLSIAAILFFGLPQFVSAGARLPIPRAYHIVVPSRPLQPGETILARLEPEPPPDAFVTWRFVQPEGLHRNWIATEYRAPYLVEPGHPPIQLSVAVEMGDFRQTVSTTVDLVPGSVPGVEDCLGPGQSFSDLYGDIDSREFCSLDEAPQLIRKVEPIYPRSSLVRGNQDPIIVQALVCKTGVILDAFTPPIYHDVLGPPIERDPKLLAAAIAAVKQYQFSPGSCATWWAIPVVFHP